MSDRGGGRGDLLQHCKRYTKNAVGGVKDALKATNGWNKQYEETTRGVGPEAGAGTRGHRDGVQGWHMHSRRHRMENWKMEGVRDGKRKPGASGVGVGTCYCVKD